jgi:hypothetical protein
MERLKGRSRWSPAPRWDWSERSPCGCLRKALRSRSATFPLSDANALVAELVIGGVYTAH